MEINQEMYRDLVRLKEQIQLTEKAAGRRAPTVCTQEALQEMARLCPKTLSDFEGVPGIGKTFIEHYGERFLAVILKYRQTETEKKVQLSSTAAETLKELEKKLVSINRRNRMLYMPKAVSKYAFDLTEAGRECAEQLLFGAQKTVTVCDTAQAAPENVQAEAMKLKRVVQLLREVNKDLRDKGKNDLYIGYPFVIGHLPGEEFEVRAPLALFPVTAERTAVSVRLSLDDARDVVYNNTLVLAYFKFNGISRPLPPNVAEECAAESFIDTLLSFYSENGITIRNEGTRTRRFVEYKAGEFPSFQPGELILEPCAVLGKFPLCDSSIQKDFDDILRANEINGLLNDLLLNAEEIDFYADPESDGIPPADAAAADPRKGEKPFSEGGRAYINDLNSSQETVLSTLDDLDENGDPGPSGHGQIADHHQPDLRFCQSGQDRADGLRKKDRP